MGVPRRFRRIVVAAAAAALPLTSIVPVHAADAKDQYEDVATNSITLHSPLAQTFTPSAGPIDKVYLKLVTPNALTITVQIQDTTNLKPTTPANVRGTSIFRGNATLPWTEFDFSPAVQVQANNRYAIVVYPSGTMTWYDSYSYASPTVTGQPFFASGSSWFNQTSSTGKEFTFEEFAVTGVSANQPPVLTENSASVTAPEGSTATLSGTYQDPNGDNVALSASPSGTLTKTGTSSGTWTWSQTAADESAPQQVTITAYDGHGGVTSVMFNVSFTPVPPTVTIVGAPATGPEGTGITLTAKATSVSPADQAAGFNYSWTVKKNNSAPSAPVAGATFTLTPDDEGTFAVTLNAVEADNSGNGASVTATVTGTNVAPKAVISSVTHSGIVLLPLTPITFDGGFTDPGALDTHTATFDYGDRSPIDTTTYAASGQGDTTDTYGFASPGTYNVTYSVTDDDGGTSVATVKVTVQTPAQALGVISNYVASMSSLNNGEKNGLDAKFRAAAASAARGDSNATCGQLDAALNDLSSLTANGRLSQADSDALASATWSVHRAMGCTKVKVAWLNLSL